MATEKIFQGDGSTFSAYREACKFLKDNGYSVGSMCRDDPMAVMKGEYLIAKWRNLTSEERLEIDGTLHAGREGNARLVLK